MVIFLTVFLIGLSPETSRSHEKPFVESYEKPFDCFLIEENRVFHRPDAKPMVQYIFRDRWGQIRDYRVRKKQTRLSFDGRFWRLRFYKKDRMITIRAPFYMYTAANYDREMSARVEMRMDLREGFRERLR